jgi:glycosyltransferase involved in cell wall biosynthesis
MRIALLAPLVAPLADPPLGGVQTFLGDLARGLQGRGHAVTVFAAHGSRVRGVEVVDTGADAGRLAGTLFRPGREQREAASADAAFAGALSLIASGGFDLVHNHAFDAAAIRESARLPVPVLHTLHLPADRVIAAALAFARRAPLRPAVAAVSRSQAEGWRHLVEVDAVLRPGLPLPSIPWTERPADARLLIAGRISPEKGVLEAVAIARSAGRPLVICGPEYDPAYAARVAEQATGGSALIRPALSRADLWREMGAASAVLCPAVWEEPFGLVAAEANACGTPVVGFRRGAIAEVVADGATAVLVAPGDLAAAAEAVPRADALSRPRCRLHAERTLSLEASLDAHLGLYDRMVQAPSP